VIGSLFYHVYFKFLIALFCLVCVTEPSATIGSVNGGLAAEPVGTSEMDALHAPRLCRLCKWADFDGYGFNLHAEKDKPGQFIGSVDPESPAELGGLKEGDRIIEVNGENIEAQSHTAVIGRIKAGGERTTMLVLDRNSDNYYKAKGITVNSDMPHVIVHTTPERNVTGQWMKHPSSAFVPLFSVSNSVFCCYCCFTLSYLGPYAGEVEAEPLSFGLANISMRAFFIVMLELTRD
jgi:membrane-associated protease RseP (regulator of RpoE activity)